MLDDVTVLYQGGSGGFALFYYLLLSGKYHTGLQYKSVHDLIQQQFPTHLSSAPSLWKHKEFWPDNLACKQSSNKPKLFLICNPTWNEDVLKINQMISNNTHKILLYTNFKLQLRMAWAKKAYWFTHVSRQKFHAPQNTKQYLRQIIQSRRNDLDPEIHSVKQQFVIDQQVELTKFVDSKKVENFGHPNQDQIDFINHWVAIQPKKTQVYFNNRCN